MTYDGRAVANFVLDFADSQGTPLSNLALQKVLFFCHAWHLVETGTPLVKQQFEAWQHGPVLQYIYRQFKASENRPIKERAKSLNGLTGAMEIVAPNLDGDTAERLKRVVRFYGRLEPWDLVEMSHVKNGPWDKVWNHEGRINPGMKISHESVRDFYSSSIAKGPIQ